MRPRRGAAACWRLVAALLVCASAAGCAQQLGTPISSHTAAAKAPAAPAAQAVQTAATSGPATVAARLPSTQLPPSVQQPLQQQQQQQQKPQQQQQQQQQPLQQQKPQQQKPPAVQQQATRLAAVNEGDDAYGGAYGDGKKPRKGEQYKDDYGIEYDPKKQVLLGVKLEMAEGYGPHQCPRYHWALEPQRNWMLTALQRALDSKDIGTKSLKGGLFDCQASGDAATTLRFVVAVTPSKKTRHECEEALRTLVGEYEANLCEQLGEYGGDCEQHQVNWFRLRLLPHMPDGVKLLPVSKAAKKDAKHGGDGDYGRGYGYGYEAPGYYESPQDYGYGGGGGYDKPDAGYDGGYDSYTGKKGGRKHKGPIANFGYVDYFDKHETPDRRTWSYREDEATPPYGWGARAVRSKWDDDHFDPPGGSKYQDAAYYEPHHQPKTYDDDDAGDRRRRLLGARRALRH